MATVSFINSGSEVANGIDAEFPLALATPLDGQTSTTFGFDLGGDAVIFIGFGFGGYVDGRPTTGTITGYQLWDLENTLPGHGSVVHDYTVSGLNLSVSDFNTFVTNSDGVGFRNAVYGGADTITGGGNADDLWGYAGADTIIAGGGDDTIYANGAVNGETYNGGLGVDTLEVGVGTSSNGLGAAADFSAATITSVERLRFSADNDAFTSAVFSANQFTGGGTIANPVIEGNGFANVVIVYMPNAGTFDASATTYLNWTPGLNADRLILTGSTGADVIVATSQSDNIAGDPLGGGGGNDTLYGGGGADFLDGMTGSDAAFGEAGNDVIRVSQGQFAAGEIADGGADLDTLMVNGTVDLRGGTVTGFERIALSNTAGSPFAIFSASQINTGFTSSVAVSGSAGVDLIGITGGSVNLSSWTFSSWSPNADIGDAILVSGSNGADTLIGSSQNDSLQGDSGPSGAADLIHGGGGDDYLDGWLGADQVYGDEGNDEIQIWSTDFAAGELADGGTGTDTLALFGSLSLGGATLASFEKLSLRDATEGGGSPPLATVTFTADQVSSAFVSSLAVSGSAQNYALQISAAANKVVDLSGWTFSGWTAGYSIRIQGTSGTNTFTGSSKADTIVGGSGADTIKGGQGNDVLSGGLGADTVDFTDVTTAITGNAASTWVGTGDGFYDQVTGMEVWRLGSGNDTLITYGAQETVYGGAGNDWVGDYGVNQNNIFYGEDGDDSLYGLGGSDTLWGGTGADFLVGGDGNDYIVGGAGIDWMDGQGGADTFFIYALSEIQGGWEAIANFQSGSDRINLQYIDADGNAGNGDTAFTVTTTGFTNTAGQIYIERPGGQNYAFVRFDTNGDSVADALLFVTGTALTSADFVL